MSELTIIMAGTNDNYGGKVYREVETTPTSNFKDRVSLSLFTLHESFSHLNYEVLFVVWNEDPQLPTITTWECFKHPRTKLIIVPPAIATTVEHERQFHEGWAKNVGIRRAQSEMVLTTNPDILWLDPFPTSCLETTTVMIAHRWTVNKAILGCGNDIGCLKRFCGDPTNRRNPDWNSNGDFTLMPKTLWHHIKGICTPPQNRMAGVDMKTIVRASRAVGGRVESYPYDIYHCEHPGMALASSYDFDIVAGNWGFPEHSFEQLGVY